VADEERAQKVGEEKRAVGFVRIKRCVLERQTTTMAEAVFLDPIAGLN
jgi:hypothetical protein